MRPPDEVAAGTVGTVADRGEQELETNPDSKDQFPTLQALYALKSWRLLRDGRAFVAVRYGRARDLPTLSDAAAFLKTIGGGQ